MLLGSITFRKSIVIPSDPSQPSITINGIDNRQGALDGLLVKVVLYKDGDHCGKVCEVLEQGPQQQFVCVWDSNNSIFFCPIDRKSPKLVNLSGLSREMLKQASNDLIIREELKYKQHAVTVFDSKSFTTPKKGVSIKFADVKVPQIKDVIPLIKHCTEASVCCVILEVEAKILIPTGCSNSSHTKRVNIILCTTNAFGPSSHQHCIS